MSLKRLYQKDDYVSKQITVFLNGSDSFQGKKMKVTWSKKLNWEHVLTDITKKVNAHFGAVKKLYTADSGTSVRSFRELVNNGNYVASDNRKFRNIEGGYKSKPNNTKNQNMEHYNTGQLIFVNHLTKLADVRSNLIVIFVCANGAPGKRTQKFVFTKEDFRNWNKCLSYIADTLSIPGRSIKFLYDAVGNQICGPWELQHGGFYVAVGYGDKFKKCAYQSWLATMEQVKPNTPVVGKDKNVPCIHKNKMVPSWNRCVKWRTYMKEGLMDAGMLEEDMFKNTNFFIDEPKFDKNLTCRCVYYTVKKDKPTLTSDDRSILIKYKQ